MTKVRYVIMKGREGDCHDKVECALRADGSSPAFDFWNELQKGVFQDGRAAFIDPESEDQISDFIVLARVLRGLIETGYPIYGRAINDLRRGIWEIKGGEARMPFFDVERESGMHTPKSRVAVRWEVDPNMQVDYWWFPHMDQTLRMTHGFIKDGDLTPEEEMSKAESIRQEDLI